ncbi:YraN family protein [Amnibacterium sp. CER49]|uniref:YraN family protein n=1 Tax=Amnibacterium sp. CER49 TaxID=3039161 RepID=UPI0024496E33|nr:YraN family protein [Amnibacterium sp. CER49]MDH2442733.1 YraN family protein [Amnibacterium sp. CER49]
MTQNDDLGRRGERLAADYLAGLGYRIIDRNWRCPSGEIDLVAVDGDELVIVEVKTRSSTAFGDPLEGVTDAKLTRLCVLAGAWRRAHPGVRTGGSRIDLVGIVAPRTRPAAIDHLRAVA